MCLDYNGTIYFYITNLQGDVVALSDQYGEVIRYEYDAWGKPLVSEYYFSSHGEVMQNNPRRYRGYIYDAETGFYYLQSRYYDPTIGRFINSDGQLNGGFLGNNMFAYCENNPILYVDKNGRDPGTDVLLLFGIEISAKAAQLLLASTLLLSAIFIITHADEINQGMSDIYYGLVDAAETLVGALTDVLADTKVKEEEKVEENSPSDALYYGAQYRNNVWSRVTGPMTLEEAIVWTNATAASNAYGKNASWGIYTQNEQDAISYMQTLQPGRPLFGPEGDAGCYLHYHYEDNNRKFMQYKHFHAWYGELT